MKLNYKRTICIGLAFMSICSFWQMYDNIIPLILQNTFHIGETVTGFIMALDNVLALFLLPFFGTLSDNTNTKIGKRTPFIVTGTFLAVIFLMVLPIADNYNRLILFITALGMLLLSMSFYRSPAVALMPDLTPKPLRSKANAVINLMGAIGAVYSLLMIKMLVKEEDRPDYFPLFMAIGIIMTVAVIILVLSVKEKKLTEAINIDDEESGGEGEAVQKEMSTEVRKSLILILASIFLWFMAYNAVTTAFSRYTYFVWGLQGGGFADCLMVATVTAIISYIPIGFLSAKIGRKKTILIGISLMSICYLLGVFYQTYHFSINIGFAFIGFGWAAINVNSYPMVVEMSKGSNIGKYTGLYYTFSMMAQIFTPILSGALLENVSYRTLFPYAFVFSVLSFITMIFVKHGDVKPEKKEFTLENFDL